MKFDNIIAAGCSFTWGDELLDRENRYMSLLAKHCGATLHDFSRNGNSNELISANLINNTSILLANKTITPENTLVVVQWSHKDRLHYYSQSGYYHRLAPHTMIFESIKVSKKNGVYKHLQDKYIDTIDLKMYYENHGSIPYLIYNMITKIHHTQMFLQNKKMKYVFMFASKYDYEALFLSREEMQLLQTGGRTYPPGSENILLPSIQGLLDDIDKSKVYEHPFLEYCKLNNYSLAIGGHPKDDAHISYSQELINFIGGLYV